MKLSLLAELFDDSLRLFENLFTFILRLRKELLKHGQISSEELLCLWISANRHYHIRHSSNNTLNYWNSCSSCCKS
ncbi:hypothetical protein JTB14_003705 [Gonioctena quinquepunctata]|nr:hypothetical protein JTB14_003705 [Gonioctena quinquepunctata]